MGDDESSAPPSDKTTEHPQHDPTHTNPSTPTNENAAQPSGSGPVQPRLLHNQQVMPYHGQQQMCYQGLQQMPQQVPQQMLYQGHQQMTYQVPQQMLHQGQQQMPYQVPQQMLHKGHQQMPYQRSSPYSALLHPYHCSPSDASNSEASTSVSFGWASPQPSTSNAQTPIQMRRAQRKVGRPRKYPLPERKEDDPAPVHAAAVGSASPVVEVPQRDEHDVCVGQSKVAKCAACILWAGRYLLEPCFHHGFCISCLEVNANIDRAQNREPACPACDTRISKYLPGIRVTIMDLNFEDE